MKDKSTSQSNLSQTITLGGGCFWCLEPVFEELQGVTDVVVGYAGGEKANPSYKQVCTGMTGHAEVVQVHFNPQVISLQQILDVFFSVHDPTTPNRQGADVGSQYRSIILYHDEIQRKAAREMINRAGKGRDLENPSCNRSTGVGKFLYRRGLPSGVLQEKPSSGVLRDGHWSKGQ